MRLQYPRGVRSRAPLRLGFSGGGTDLAAFSELYGGAVLNGTIHLYAFVTLTPSPDGFVRFRAADLNQEVRFPAGSLIPDEEPLRIHRGVYKRITQEFLAGEAPAITVTSFSDVPPGSGLGSSSTVVVALVEAYKAYLGLPFGEYDVARLAYEIERLDLALAGGKQDQYAATFGGINYMEFLPGDHVVVNPLRIPSPTLCELESSLLLVGTGTSRESSLVVNEQVQLLEAGHEASLGAMRQLVDEAREMKDALLRADFRRMSEVLGRGWEAKKRTAKGVSNSRIEAIHERAIEAGALAGKVSGAGGGGIMLFLTDPVLKPAVQRSVLELGATSMNCRFTKRGAESWGIL